jgi:hypothetical protein
MSMPEKRVDCERHGVSHATFLCEHLMKRDGSGFHPGYDADRPDDPRPDAWCEACDALQERAGGWTDEAQAQARISLACAGCYDEIRRRETGPALDSDGWHLRNALDHGEAMPPLAEREALVAGEAAKLVFELPAAIEAMWVVVVEAAETGLTGVLDSQPRSADRPRRGARFEFGPEHIVEIERHVPGDHLRQLGVR